MSECVVDFGATTGLGTPLTDSRRFDCSRSYDGNTLALRDIWFFQGESFAADSVLTRESNDNKKRSHVEEVEIAAGKTN